MADINDAAGSLSNLADEIRGVDIETSGNAISDVRDAFAALADGDRLAEVSSIDSDLDTVRSLLGQAADLAASAAERLRQWGG